MASLRENEMINKSNKHLLITNEGGWESSLHQYHTLRAKQVLYSALPFHISTDTILTLWIKACFITLILGVCLFVGGWMVSNEHWVS